ncbi:precorrin-6y C5,15-methyltransferase (decarboxylating) subunit CbiE [Clostridium beijerinckii]|uniref:Cobalt-precorrin-7 (C5)-methyltransferase n=1 Tax=Clostridium beijerinckii TaxID=1520 RepID=A0A9Q5CYY8_CLOBE|nr:precorrin-6y C5,15-methyltransferase (decarboxylating) subunit CbiE [Clostridium beijerinckii]AQS05049.1 putative cobalt-precorrin-6Y C(5)-methyltransferase [Clostridium beijerinckii]MBA2886039.1 cobalt-precorrin-7 (C5)-methyltransferase [Clostridium beijerinckii]MBA2900673.1 cobalt-precorrin-7 (C5)-methyltransferase [Clostridium beijerinckii]MBA2910598.1 cobalt-precorrin-7 (C5)-methyltransferase [Clostridium beijerinckii]MBA9015381.1 cobalt-precorrin-7 (C5)-methyltransferase [Clostridium b
MIYIVGLGPGHRDYIMPKALEILKKSNIIIGFKRALDSLEFIDNKKIYINKLIDINEYICDEKNRSMIISIVASGDPTFYGITNYIKSKATLEFQVIPGISSFQYLTCKLNMSWNNAYLGSLHGRKEDFLTVVNNHDLSIWLTDKENNPAILCEILHKEKVRCKVVIGENLSYEDEIITNGTPEEFMNKKYDSLSVFIVDRTSR